MNHPVQLSFEDFIRKWGEASMDIEWERREPGDATEGRRERERGEGEGEQNRRNAKRLTNNIDEASVLLAFLSCSYPRDCAQSGEDLTIICNRCKFVHVCML